MADETLVWKRYDYEDKTTWLTQEGTYRVMVRGDSESCDGRTIYEYLDYPTWAEVIYDEDDEVDSYFMFGQGMHGEEHESFFAYYGPITIPPLPEKL